MYYVQINECKYYNLKGYFLKGYFKTKNDAREAIDLECEKLNLKLYNNKGVKIKDARKEISFIIKKTA